MGQELSQIIDPFSVEAQILQDTLKSEIAESEQAHRPEDKEDRPPGAPQCEIAGGEVFSGMTAEETEIYRQMLGSLPSAGSPSLLTYDSHRKALTGKKDILREYEVVRLLDDVPMFAGVGRE